MSEDLTKQLPPSVDEKLTLILKTVQSLTVRADSVDSQLLRFEETLDDVRPVWRLLVTDVAHLRQGQLLLEAGQQRLEEGLGNLRSEVREFRRVVDHRFLILSGTVLDRYNKLEQRVTRLELNSNPPNTQT